MIRKFEVRGLNDRIDANLEFNEDLNIITGRNGSGKTTLLKLIWYLVSGNLERILPEIPFQFVSIETDLFSLSMVQIKPEQVKIELNDQQKETPEKPLVVAVDSETGNLTQPEDGTKLDEVNSRIAHMMKSSLFFPTFRRIEGGFSVPPRYVSADPNLVRRLTPYRTTERLQDAMLELSSVVSVYDHKFIASISTHDIVRLLTQKYADISEEINELQAKLSQEITQKIKDYSGNKPDSEDQKSQGATPVLDDIQKSVEQATQKREALLKPFSVLAGLTQEILQYQQIGVAERFTSRERTEGITLGKGTEGITLGVANEAIASEKLSAGEKQMLSFLCYNAFSDNTTIFIDEPELSLHVDWQRLLLPTLLEQGTGNQFFIATHSPFIFARYQHKEILLGKDRGNKGEES